MYRIDENTYIDDTLITCAEYQLFLDEMRAKGKYWQPDHWLTYQFPGGQARRPIVGIRHSDAKAFCKWLAQREDGEWNYRLPDAAEAALSPLKPYAQTPLGYWLTGTEILRGSTFNQFAWADGSIPENPRALSRGLDLTLALDRDLDRAIDLDHTIGHDLNIDRALDRTITRDLARARILALALVRDRSLGHEIGLGQAQAHTHTHALNRALDIYIDILTLQERVAGRSPAFEGIRIVKERNLKEKP
jgi:hypothetical protein